MANKVKMIEDKLSGSKPEDHTETVTQQAPAPLPVTAAPIPYGPPSKQPTKADYPPAGRPPPDDDETSFTKNRPPTASSRHGARPKTPNTNDDDYTQSRPTSHRRSLDLPHIAD